MRPQKYDPSLGIQGNLEEALWENQYRKNEISNEQGARSQADAENRTSIEQTITDLDIMQISAEQSITDLDIRIMELGG